MKAISSREKVAKILSMGICLAVLPVPGVAAELGQTNRKAPGHIMARLRLFAR